VRQLLFIVALVSSILGLLAVVRIGPAANDIGLLSSWVLTLGWLVWLDHLHDEPVKRIELLSDYDRPPAPLPVDDVRSRITPKRLWSDG
jgi:hypothetical protein